MKIRERKEAALVASGIILGASIAAPAAGAALTAQQSSQEIIVDGKPVQIEAYSIGGSNYCKLRDVGKAVGFSVAYNALTNTVEISTSEPYTEVASLSRTITLPTDGSQYVPRVGDIVLCDDGTEYEGNNLNQLTVMARQGRIEQINYERFTKAYQKVWQALNSLQSREV